MIKTCKIIKEQFLYSMTLYYSKKVKIISYLLELFTESSDQEYLSAMKEAEKKRTSFQKIFDRSNYIHYPDSSWATHKINSPEKMLVSVQVKTRYLNECLLAPYIYKQVNLFLHNIIFKLLIAVGFIW